MRERPILFSAPMVNALLAGVKTQTRREIKPSWSRCLDLDNVLDRTTAQRTGRYGKPGDRLWVRETWRTHERERDGVDGIHFFADAAFVPIPATRGAADKWIEMHDDGHHGATWRPSIHMPRWASRITLEITDVRVQRLHDISEDDAKAEGTGCWSCGRVLAVRPAERPDCCLCEAEGGERIARDGFFVLWESINGAGSARLNPFVWAISFKRIG